MLHITYILYFIVPDPSISDYAYAYLKIKLSLADIVFFFSILNHMANNRIENLEKIRG